MRVPLFIEFSGRNVLVIGGGEVGTKRAKKFLEAGANVVVLSKEFSEELRQLESEGKVMLVQVDLTEATSIQTLSFWITWADLVVYTVPDDRLAMLVRSLCKIHRKLLNDATSAEYTDVVIPMESKVDSIRIAVTTEGKSSILAKVVLRELARYIENNNELRNYATTWFSVKDYLKRNVKDRKLRMRIYYELSSDSVFNELAKKSPEDALRYVYEKVKKLIEGS